MKEVTLSREEWEKMAAEMNIDPEVCGAGVRIPGPSPYYRLIEGYTDEELQIEEDKAREQLRQIMAREKEISTQRPENLQKHGIVVSIPNISGSPGVCVQH